MCKVSIQEPSETAPNGAELFPEQNAARERVAKVQRVLGSKAETGRKLKGLYNLVYNPDFLLAAYTHLHNGERHECPDDGRRLVSVLHEELKTGRYSPLAVRCRLSRRPGANERELEVPAHRDQVVQRALHLMLAPIIRANTQASAYGWQKKRGHVQATEAAAVLIEDAWPSCDLVRTDIQKCFQNIRHRDVLRALRAIVADERVIELVHRILRAEVEDREGVRRQRHRGLATGAVLSPLLATLVLGKLDRYLSSTPCVRYGDDLLLAFRTVLRPTPKQRVEHLNTFVEQYLGLELAQHKTQVLHPNAPLLFLGTRFVRDAASGGVQMKMPDTAITAASNRIDTAITECGVPGCVKLHRRVGGILAGTAGAFPEDLEGLSRIDEHAYSMMLAHGHADLARGWPAGVQTAVQVAGRRPRRRGPRNTVDPDSYLRTAKLGPSAWIDSQLPCPPAVSLGGMEVHELGELYRQQRAWGELVQVRRREAGLQLRELRKKRHHAEERVRAAYWGQPLSRKRHALYTAKIEGYLEQIEREQYVATLCRLLDTTIEAVEATKRSILAAGSQVTGQPIEELKRHARG